MFDLKNSIKVDKALNIGAISSNTTTAGTAIDLTGYNSLTFVIQSGTLTDGTYTPKIEESSDNSTFTEVTDTTKLLGTIAGATFASTDDNAVKTIGYIGNKPYVKLSIVSTSVTSGGTLGATAIKGHPVNSPIA
jgi:hypothetical protein